MQNKKSRPVSAYQRFSWLGCKRLLGASDPILTSFNLTNIQYSDNMTCLLSCSIYIYTYRDTRAMYEVFAVITRANTTYNWQTNLPLYEGCVTTSNLPHPHTQEDRTMRAKLLTPLGAFKAEPCLKELTFFPHTHTNTHTKNMHTRKHTSYTIHKHRQTHIHAQKKRAHNRTEIHTHTDTPSWGQKSNPHTQV